MVRKIVLGDYSFYGFSGVENQTIFIKEWLKLVLQLLWNISWI
jgi:hypothetical protein